MLGQTELNEINGVISILQQMTSGNVAHKRDTCICILRSMIALQPDRAAKIKMPSWEEIVPALRADNVKENATYILGASQAYGIIARHFGHCDL
jgi:hypothetical protein